MIEAVSNNPYAVLGVYSNASLKDITANKGKMSAFLRVGKPVTFPIDTLLPEGIIRTQENVAKAESDLILPKDKVVFALFWYCNATPLDKVALASLQSGDSTKALDIWAKKNTYSSLINMGVYYLSVEDWDNAIRVYGDLLHKEQIVNEFVSSVAGSAFSISCDELSKSFIDTIVHQNTGVNWTKVFETNYGSNSDIEYVKTLFVGEPKKIINDAIAEAKSVPGKDSAANLKAGSKLMTVTKTPLKELKSLLGSGSDEYRIIADKLANQILQCGINYYNNSEDYQAPIKAMKLQKYAGSIAVGKMCKDRCDENTRILQSHIDAMLPAEVAEEATKIEAELTKFCSLPDEIKYAVTLLNNTKPLLQTIKTKIGSSNEKYLKLSTKIVANALHNVIEEVNEAQRPDTINIGGQTIELPMSVMNDWDREQKLAKIKAALRAAWDATKIMDTFDLESDFKTNRYDGNRSTLANLCRQVGISTYSSSSPSTSRPSTLTSSRPVFTPPTPKKETSWAEENPGCIIWIVLGIIGIIIAAIAG